MARTHARTHARPQDTAAVVNAAHPFGAWVQALFAGIDTALEEKVIVALPCAESSSLTRSDHDVLTRSG
eukprot:SAG25_NODE_6229_length_577_cov_0.968619_1_plen_68_part_01